MPANTTERPTNTGRALLLGAVGIVSAIFVVGGLATRDDPVARAQERRELRRLIEEIAGPVRSAWVVDLEAPDRLVAVDAFGAETRFERRGGELVVSRPSGSTGVLLRGLRSLDFDARLVRRLREAPPTIVPGEVLAREAHGVSQVQAVLPGDDFALAFTLNSKAAGEPSPVQGVREQLLSCRLAEAEVPLCRVDGRPTAARLQLSLCESRGPDDARPLARTGVLARSVVTLAGLPEAAAGDPALMRLDLKGLQPTAPLIPGRSYALVLEPLDGPLGVRVVAGTDAIAAGVARRTGSGEWQVQPVRASLRLCGPRRFTQTVAHEVVERVDLSVTLANGRRARLPMVVAGQSAAQHRWLGAVPGELPAVACARTETPSERPAERPTQEVAR